MDLIFRVQLNESQRCKQTSCTENIPTLLSASLGNSFQQWRQRLFDLISKWIELICSNFEMDCNTLTKFAFFNSEMCCAPSWSRLMQDRVSRVLFPSTFVLLNIIYWLVFRSPSRTCQIIFTVSDFANIERFPNCPNILCCEDPPDPLYRIPSTTPFIEFLPLLIEKIVLLCILHQLSHIWENEKLPPKWIKKKMFFSFQRHHCLPKPGQQRPSSCVIFTDKWKTKSWKQCDSEQPVKTLVVISQNHKNKIRAILFIK